MHTQEQLPFSYFIGNINIINKLKLELLRLNGLLFICKDNDFDYINEAIANAKRNLIFNQKLFN